MNSGTTQYEWAKTIPCRNIKIHGYCKWEKKGCSFNHDDPSRKPNSETTPVSEPTSASTTFSAESVPIIKTNSGQVKTPVPNSSPLASHSETADTGARKKFNFDTPSFTPTGSMVSKFADLSSKLSDIPAFSPSSATAVPASSGLPFDPESAPIFTPGLQSEAEPFFQQTNPFPINYHLYAGQPPPHIHHHLKPHEKTVSDLFIPNNLREEIQRKNEESLRSISVAQSGLPIHVNQYHSLCPIDQKFETSAKSFGYVSSVYKAMSNLDGKLYTMRRLENVPITSEACFRSVSKWKSLNCANVVKLYEVMTTRAFDDNSLVLVYDYYPMSLNLLEAHFFKIGEKDPELITEPLLWSYLIQLTNALSEVHKAGLAVRIFDPTKIIVTNKGRIRLSACGVYDILEAATKESPKDTLEDLQKGDLQGMGMLLLDLAKSLVFSKVQNLGVTETIPKLTVSDKFKDVLRKLTTQDISVAQLQQIIAPEILLFTNGLQDSADYMEACLSREVENARLVRLFAKLDSICDRPEFIKDGSWSETGERYPIKLFRDYVFHQVDETGKPVLDLTHVVNCLNKLDAGVKETILLVSPDEMSCLIVSYETLRDLVEKSFRQLRS
ncbi:hypothetical protein OGAPHI_003772 [Ogataea philodendri]|uniref:PAN2-PAN3 deadenylation complex subunit PAN3 n=1 Tax=Ogataea philodendri TaxID=1378263 RepID=A0A9P8T502_9ASCO|nr:uncharacterized protein OGAPHI_003772 [Ogataea philodendri]KAH3665585.1 hypothetical protein OGAPHI_003772 [Ogataea philodendri]